RAGTLTISNASGVIGTVGLIGMGLGAQLVESPGSLATVAGGGNIVPSSVPESANTARLLEPYGITIDNTGNIYIADTINNLIEQVDAKTQNIRVLAGGGNVIPSTNAEAATDAALFAPTNIVVDAAGNIYISDLGNDLVE